MDSFLTAWSTSTEPYSMHTTPRLADEGIKFEALLSTNQFLYCCNETKKPYAC
jgi:hypothetical protein